MRGSNDPVVVLRTAERDGLLTYRGFDATSGFEVELAGRVMSLPQRSAVASVRRLRTIEQLRQAGGTLSVVELRDDDTWVLESAGIQWTVAGPEFEDWVRGFQAGLAGNGQRHVGDDQIGEIEDLLLRPSLKDQCRMVLLGLMHGGEETVSSEQLREKIGQLPGVDKKPTKKTVVDSLGFGAFLADDLCENMIATFGLRWSVTAAGLVWWRSAGGPAAQGELPEMPALVRLRMIVAASREGWLRYVDQPSPNRARWRPSYDLVVGSQQHTVSVASLRSWLAGLAAYHGVAHVPGERGL